MKKEIGKRKVEIHKMEGLYPYVRLEDFMFVVKQLEEENKKLKSDLAYERTMLDNVRAEYKSLQNVIKELKEELSKYKKQYQHSMGFMEEDTLQELKDIGEI